MLTEIRRNFWIDLSEIIIAKIDEDTPNEVDVEMKDDVDYTVIECNDEEEAKEVLRKIIQSVNGRSPRTPVNLRGMRADGLWDADVVTNGVEIEGTEGRYDLY